MDSTADCQCYLDELAPNDPRVISALETVDDHDGDNYVLWTAEHALHRIDGKHYRTVREFIKSKVLKHSPILLKAKQKYARF